MVSNDSNDVATSRTRSINEDETTCGKLYGVGTENHLNLYWTINQNNEQSVVKLPTEIHQTIPAEQSNYCHAPADQSRLITTANLAVDAWQQPLQWQSTNSVTSEFIRDCQSHHGRWRRQSPVAQIQEGHRKTHQSSPTTQSSSLRMSNYDESYDDDDDSRIQKNRVRSTVSMATAAAAGTRTHQLSTFSNGSWYEPQYAIVRICPDALLSVALQSSLRSSYLRKSRLRNNARHEIPNNNGRNVTQLCSKYSYQKLLKSFFKLQSITLSLFFWDTVYISYSALEVWFN